MRCDVRTNELGLSVPNAVDFVRLAPRNIEEPLKGRLLTIICHEVKPVNVRLDVREIKVLEVPIRRWQSHRDAVLGALLSSWSA